MPVASPTAKSVTPQGLVAATGKLDDTAVVADTKSAISVIPLIVEGLLTRADQLWRLLRHVSWDPETQTKVLGYQLTF